MIVDASAAAAIAAGSARKSFTGVRRTSISMTAAALSKAGWADRGRTMFSGPDSPCALRA